MYELRLVGSSGRTLSCVSSLQHSLLRGELGLLVSSGRTLYCEKRIRGIWSWIDRLQSLNCILYTAQSRYTVFRVRNLFCLFWLFQTVLFSQILCSVTRSRERFSLFLRSNCCFSWGLAVIYKWSRYAFRCAIGGQNKSQQPWFGESEIDVARSSSSHVALLWDAENFFQMVSKISSKSDFGRWNSVSN